MQKTEVAATAVLACLLLMGQAMAGFMWPKNCVTAEIAATDEPVAVIIAEAGESFSIDNWTATIDSKAVPLEVWVNGERNSSIEVATNEDVLYFVAFTDANFTRMEVFNADGSLEIFCEDGAIACPLKSPPSSEKQTW